MITCWVIYTYEHQLSGYMANIFTGDSYQEIEDDMKDWKDGRSDIKIIDVTESVYKDED